MVHPLKVLFQMSVGILFAVESTYHPSISIFWGVD